MSDDAYMPVSRRDPRFIDRAFTFDIAQSHAVVDSVAQELADALREALALRSQLSYSPSVGAATARKSHKALMRFDNLNNLNNQNTKEQQ